MGSSSESKKEMDTGSSMEIFVPVSDQRQNCLHISRRHLLSVKYVKEMEGELRPLYSLVQQQEIGLNLMPFTSTFELEICLAKANGFIKTKDMVQWKIEKSQTMEQVLRVKNASQSQEPEWRKNWIVQSRQRKNGKYDKYYYHKYSNIMCRSLVEIDRFEMNGILPKHASKNNNYNAKGRSVPLVSKGTRKMSLKRKITSQSFDNCSHIENKMCFPSNNSDARLKRETEKFLKKSYDNLRNIFKEGSKSNEKKKKSRVGSSKDGEGNNAASIDNRSQDTKPIKN